MPLPARHSRARGLAGTRVRRAPVCATRVHRARRRSRLAHPPSCRWRTPRTRWPRLLPHTSPAHTPRTSAPRSRRPLSGTRHRTGRRLPLAHGSASRGCCCARGTCCTCRTARASTCRLCSSRDLRRRLWMLRPTLPKTNSVGIDHSHSKLNRNQLRGKIMWLTLYTCFVGICCMSKYLKSYQSEKSVPVHMNMKSCANYCPVVSRSHRGMHCNQRHSLLGKSWPCNHTTNDHQSDWRPGTARTPRTSSCKSSGRYTGPVRAPVRRAKQAENSTAHASTLTPVVHGPSI